jgi:hypothetical protein
MPQAGKIETFFFNFLKKDFSTKCEIFLTASPHFLEKLQTNIAAIGGGTLSSISPRHPTIPLPPFVENVVDPSNSTNTKHKKKSQTEKV